MREAYKMEDKEMSGRFMRTKKICIPVLTLLVIVSQLTGCAGSTSDELFKMLQTNQSITIEINEPKSMEQGTEREVDWTILAHLNTYSDLRFAVDDFLGITPFGDNGKSGVIYVDLEGKHTDNSTLYNAFMNKKFVERAFENEKFNRVLAEEAMKIYVDVDTEVEAILAGYNAYFNLLNDAEEGYANMNSTLSRLEAMSMVVKADTGVQGLDYSDKFVKTVGDSDLALIASQAESQSFLKSINSSLDMVTATATMTKGEFIYLLVNRYLTDEFDKVTGKESAYSDNKNIGNKFDQLLSKKSISTESRLEAAELRYCLENPNNGMPEELYKAMVVAKKYNLINGSESNWNEGITKLEALSMLLKTYSQLETRFSVDRGESTGAAVGNTIQPEQLTQEEFENKEAEIVQNDMDEYRTENREYIESILTSPEHAIKNEEKDTYTFSDEFLSICQTYHFFANSTYEEIADFLGGHWSTLIDRTLSDGIVVFETVITNEQFIKDYGNESGQLPKKEIQKVEQTTQQPEQQPQQSQQPTQNHQTSGNQNKPQNQPVSDNTETSGNSGSSESGNQEVIDNGFFNKPEGWDENVGNIISDVTIH